MAVDLTGGLDIAREYVFAEPPKIDQMRDAVNMWLWDDRGEIGFPRVAVEATAPAWSEHELNMSLTFPDGRILRHWEPGPAHSPIGPRGLATMFGAGPMSFECIEPFHRYRTTFKGTAVDTSFEALSHARRDTRRVELEYEVECETVAPPWVQGAMATGLEHVATSGGDKGDLMGGDRLEQLMKVTGQVKVDGKAQTFTGGGNRIRRQGIRIFQGFWGHCWQATAFPSGRAFGYIAYPPRDDGQPTYNEGYIFTGDGGLIPAKVVEAPWLHDLQFSGEDVSCVLESALGRTRITAQLAMAAPSLHMDATGVQNFPPLLQGVARYTWDGETAYGMIERSNLHHRVTLPK